MAGRQVAVLTSISQLFRLGAVSGLDDGVLLERFATRNDEAAFAALVAQHGPMVLGVCRRIVRDEHDVEDAFQATFLVLVQRANSIKDPGRLGPWLHGVARRVAMRARAQAIRRRSRSGPSQQPAVAEEPAMRHAFRADGDDVLEVIDEEVARLPEQYRGAVVLCDLEGRSYAEAARRLRCPLGTLQSRLARGRARLRTRLVKRGVAPFAVTAILAGSARAAVPDALAQATIRAATAGAVSASAAALAGSIARGLVMSTVKTVAGALILAALPLAAGLVARDRLLAEPPGPAPIPGPPLAQAPQPPRSGRTLELEVVDAADRSPLAGASVLIRVTRGQAQTSQGTTDDEGRFPIALAGDTTYFLQVVAAHPGFVPIEVRWSGTNIPGAYTLALPRGVAIGGVVRDEQGRPIAGARVFASLTNIGPGGPERYATLGGEVAGVLTDAEGRWRSETLPATAGPGTRLAVEITHPDFSTIRQNMTAGEARKFSSVHVMKQGTSVTGTVLSPTGRPVAGATVVVQSMGDQWKSRRLQTDRQGQFRTGRFIDPKWAEIMVTVQADGAAWAMRQITVTPEIPPQVIKLAPRRPLSGRVVDSQGRPIAGAAVGSTNALFNGHFDWEAETDAGGRFIWFDAPVNGTVLLDVYEAPFVQALGRRVEPGSDEVTITLHRPQHLNGTVTDAETGRPIDRFVLIPGWGPRPGTRPEWLQGSARPFGAGKFDLPEGLFPDQGFPRSIRIEAEGYVPGELLGFLDNVEDIAHDFKVKKAATLTGIIRGPDGRPLAGADVALSGGDYDARIENGRLRANRTVREAPHMKTGPDGRYTFRPPGERVSIIAAHDAGFAIRSAAELAASTDITLMPWGRIEGVMKIGTRPAPGQKAAAWMLNAGFSGRVDYDARTDESGRFVWERVTPGRMEVYRYVEDANHRGWTASHPVSVEVKPGETARAQVGGTGRPVIGRLAVPAGVALADLVLDHGGNLSTERPEPATPLDFPDRTGEQQEEWWAAYSKTPEGRAYFENRQRQYALALGSDGTFRIEDVPPGRYVLRLPFEGRTDFYRAGRAFARADVVVPEIPGGRSDEPLDIGVVPLEVFPFHELNVGDRVPAIASRAADGRPLDLGAVRGKFVLLVFWADSSWAIASIPYVKATYDSFGRDPRLVIIGLYRGASPEKMRRYAAHRGLAWEQRYLGNWEDANPIAAAFGVRIPAAVFLIGPDGRVIAKDLQGDAIKEAVARALKPQPAPNR